MVGCPIVLCSAPSVSQSIFTITEKASRFLNVKAIVGAFNQEKALVGAFSVIVKPMEHYTALLIIIATHFSAGTLVAVHVVLS